MFRPKRGSVRRLLLICGVLPVAYVITGRLGLLLAVPPGYATAAFLPAGIAITATFIAGTATLPSVFAGSFLLNIWIGYSSTHQPGASVVTTALVIACASTLQALIGGAVLRRVIGYPAAFDTPRDIMLFLVLSPVLCLVSATLSLSGMWALGAVHAPDLPINWMTWWVGDTLGVVLALPLILVVVGEPQLLWRRRAGLVAVPMMLCFAFFVVIFVRVSRWEAEASLLEFRLQSQRVAETMKSSLEEQALLLNQLSSVFSTRRQALTRQDFHDLVRQLLHHYPTIQAVEWAPQIAATQRQRFEAAQMVDFPDFAIRERSSSRQLKPAGNRSQFYPVTYVEPLLGNEEAVGFDLISDADRRAAIEATISSGRVITTAPIRLVQEHENQAGILLVNAVREGPTGPGIVLTVLRMGAFVSTLAGPLDTMLNIRFGDEAGKLLFFDNFAASTHAIYTTAFEFGTHRYILETTPTALYLAQYRGWQSWAVLAGGLLSAGLLGAFLMLGTGHAYQVERLAEHKSRLAAIVEFSGDAIISKSLDGVVNSWNQGAERLFGYSASEIVGQPIRRIIPVERAAEEDAILARVKAGQAVENCETECVTKDARRIPVSITVSPIKDRFGSVIGASEVVRDITRRKAAEAREKLLIQEVQHRSNNLLAVIQAIAQRSLSDADSLVGAKARFEARLHALARAYRRLTVSYWTGVLLADIVRDELEPFAARIKIDGPDVILDPNQAQNFSLAVHELATNAVKYGALSAAGGSVSVSWCLAVDKGSQVLKFKWQEQGGPPVVAPSHQGCGTLLLNATFGGAQFDYRADGLTCAIDLVPLSVRGGHGPTPLTH